LELLGAGVQSRSQLGQFDSVGIDVGGGFCHEVVGGAVVCGG
jgi:hypothetical protein